MNDRREPTISGMRVDPEEAKTRNQRGQASARSSAASRAVSSGRPAPARPVVVKSTLAPVAMFVALAACGAAGFLYWQGMEMQKVLAQADARIIELENKLSMSDDESNASTAQIQASLKEAHSEIRKLWGVSYDRNRKAIADNEAQAEAAKKQAKNAADKVANLSSQLAVVSDLVDAQQTALTSIEQSNASVAEQARKVNEKAASLEQKIAEFERRVDNTEKDIEAINGFRRSVNQQLLELKGAR